jgi:hypothetical protein
MLHISLPANAYQHSLLRKLFGGVSQPEPPWNGGGASPLPGFLYSPLGPRLHGHDSHTPKPPCALVVPQ